MPLLHPRGTRWALHQVLRGRPPGTRPHSLCSHRALGLVLINKTLGPGLKKLAQVQKEETVMPCSSAGQTALGEPGAPAYSCHLEQRQLLHSSLGMAGP